MTDKTIFEYDNYRNFLKDAYSELKTKDSKFSHRYIARLTGFKSPSQLNDIISGRRNLTASTTRRFAKAFKLNKEETYFFINLVFFNQAKTSEDRLVFAEQLLKSQKFKDLHPLKELQYNYYSKWFLVVVRELIGCASFKENPEWIAKKLSPKITGQQAQMALDELLKLGLVRREKGKLVQVDANVTAPDEVISAAIRKFHSDMAQMAAGAVNRFGLDLRETTSVTFELSEENIKIIKEKIRKFRTELVEMNKKGGKANRIFQLNLHLFPLTERLEEE